MLCFTKVIHKLLAWQKDILSYISLDSTCLYLYFSMASNIFCTQIHMIKVTVTKLGATKKLLSNLKLPWKDY